MLAGGDISQTGRRRRSGSRTGSLGGRGKSLKITNVQKILIANKGLYIIFGHLLD
jgi:hypothetical protein